VVLQGNLKNAKGKFVTKRAEAIKEIDDFEGTRDAAAAIRNKVIDNLDLWLERFETKAQETGATVKWARDGAEVCKPGDRDRAQAWRDQGHQIEVDAVGGSRP
jgi:L-lactate dehydrogenase complex protein LldF